MDQVYRPSLSPQVNLDLPENKALRSLLSDISLRILSMGAGSFIENFVQAAGETLSADMLLISRVKSKDIPVETYALFDRRGEATQYTYPIAGTPCEQVIDNACSLVVNDEVAACFPDDKDLADFGLHSYIGTPLKDENDTPIGLIAALWGTARADLHLEIKALEYFAPLLAENMLQLESKARNELAVAGAASGAWFMDFEEDTEYFSRAAKRVIGMPDMPCKAKRNSAINRLAPEDRRILMAAFEAYRRGEAPFDVNFRVVSDGEGVRWLRMTGKANRNADNRITAIAGDLTDITELVEAKRLAEAASRAKSEFLSTMSHEIRTPMNGVLSMAGLLARADIPSEQKRQADVIRKSGEAMMVILNDVLDLSKIEAGKLVLENRVFSPRELIEDVSMLWRDTIKQKGIHFETQVSEQVPEYVIGDETRLRQVLTNLISNALKFTPKGQIFLTLENKTCKQAPGLKFSVKDSGIGITKEQQTHLFKAFDQADKTISRRFGGTGLGLSISDKIVRLMGGAFNITSTPGQGSTFSFTISAETANAEKMQKVEVSQIPSAAHEQKQKTPEATAKNKRTILIADDNDINRSVLKAFLSRLPLDLIFVENGAEAVEAASAQTFDIILMDVQMPILDGISATRAIRKSDSLCRNTPIIALTANAMPGDRQRYLDAGMTGYVSKPIDPAALFQALKEAKPLNLNLNDTTGSKRMA